MNYQINLELEKTFLQSLNCHIKKSRINIYSESNISKICLKSDRKAQEKINFKGED